MRDIPEIVGLAPLMRMAFEGRDLAPVWDDRLARAQADPQDAAALFDLATMLLMNGRPEEGLRLQAQAVALSRVFRLAHPGPVTLRLLALVARGDFMANTPLDLLLEGSGVALTLAYLDETGAPPRGLPPHDLAFLAVGESAANRPILHGVAAHLRRWPTPVMNAAPDMIAGLTRDGVCALFADSPVVLAPRSRRAGRAALQAATSPGRSSCARSTRMRATAW
jgi:hypothetical protein